MSKTLHFEREKTTTDFLAACDVNIWQDINTFGLVTSSSPWKHAVGFLLDLLKPKYVDIVDFTDEFLRFDIEHLHEGMHGRQYRVHVGNLRERSHC